MNCKGIYLDYAANAPIDPRVLKAMKPYLENFVGNSSSIHDFGIRAGNAVRESRATVANLLGFQSEEIIFTSGATESNNMVLKGLAIHELFHSGDRTNLRKHIIVSSIEHASILKVCAELHSWGFEITYVKPNNKGVVSVEDIKKVIRKDTLLVSVMGVNNEVGTYNRIDEIGELAGKYGAAMMADCTQLIGSFLENSQISFAQKYKHVNFFTFSSHKLYGPTGVGCLIIHNGYALDALIQGGGQERDMRGGTSNTAGIVGMTKAMSLLKENGSTYARYEELRKRLIKQLDDNKISYAINGKINNNYNNIISITFKDFDSDKLADDYACRGIAVSAGSACENSSATGQINVALSHVLKSMGLSNKDTKNTIRISLGHNTTKKDIDEFIRVTLEIKKETEELKERKWG